MYRKLLCINRQARRHFLICSDSQCHIKSSRSHAWSHIHSTNYLPIVLPLWWEVLCCITFDTTSCWSRLQRDRRCHGQSCIYVQRNILGPSSSHWYARVILPSCTILLAKTVKNTRIINLRGTKPTVQSWETSFRPIRWEALRHVSALVILVWRRDMVRDEKVPNYVQRCIW